MKKKALRILAAVWVALPFLSYAQSAELSKVFTVKLGPENQAAQFGLNLGKFQPYAGVDFFSVKAKGTLGLDILEPNTADTRLYKSAAMEFSLDGSVNLWIPHVGTKYYFSLGESRPYVFADVFKSFASLDASLEGTVNSYSEDGKPVAGGSSHENLNLIPDKTKEFLEDLLGYWGVDFGFGVEWRVNPHFGIAGEYGFKLNFAHAKSTNQGGGLLGELLGGGTTGAATNGNQLASQINTTVDVSASLKTSQVAVALNFYF